MIQLEHNLTTDTAQVQSSSNNHSAMEMDNCFVALPPRMEATAKFPPGCSVLVCCYDGQSMTIYDAHKSKALLVSKVVQGVVQEVGINPQDPSGHRETLYKIQDNTNTNNDGAVMLAYEKDMQFALGTPVWLTTNDDTDIQKKERAIVIGSEHLPVIADLLLKANYPSIAYSVQRLEGMCTIRHGVTSELLSYRGPNDNETGNDSDKDLDAATIPARQENERTVTPETVPVPKTVSPQGATALKDTKKKKKSVAFSTDTACPLQANNTGNTRPKPRIILKNLRNKTPQEPSTAATGDKLASAPTMDMAPIQDTDSLSDSSSATSSKGSVPKKAAVANAVPEQQDTSSVSDSSSATTGSSKGSAPKKVTFANIIATRDDTGPGAKKNAPNSVPEPSSTADIPRIPRTGKHMDLDKDKQEDSLMQPTFNALSVDAADGIDSLESLVRYTASLPAAPEETGANTTTATNMGTMTASGLYNPFERIVVGAKHDLSRAFEGLKRGKLGSFPWCLRYHLMGGVCNTRSTCMRARDHHPLSPEHAKRFEAALAPIISPHGPIICRPVPVASSTSSSTNNDNYAVGKHALDRYTWNGQGHQHEQGMPPTKRIKESTLITHAEPSMSPDHATANAPKVSIHFRLPSYFGSRFYSMAIMGEHGEIGTDLCNQFDCTIDFEGHLIGIPNSDGSNNKLGANITGGNLSKLFQCRTAMEDLLVRAAHPTARGYLLFFLGMVNDHLQKQSAIVQTRDPFQDINNSSGANKLCHVTVVKTRRKAGGNNILTFSQIEEWIPTLEERYPSIRISLVKYCEDHHEQIYPHTVLCGPSFDEVYRCREDLKNLLPSNPYGPAPHHHA